MKGWRSTQLQNLDLFIKVLLAQSSAQRVRSGAEFQQRGQKSCADSFQMFPPELCEAARCCSG